MRKSIVLLSGGLDSTTVLYYAKAKRFQPYALIVDYGQRHRKEIKHAEKIACLLKCPSHVVRIAFPWQGSSLLDKRIQLPYHTTIDPHKIPSTYVPGRNIVFLSFAVSYAEAVGATGVFIGANAIDYSGYPDCRPEFFRAYETTIQRGMKSGVQGKAIKIYTPLIRKTKTQIIRLGHRLNVPFELTWSCYQGDRIPCGRCDSCVLRRKGFEGAGVVDPVEMKK
ncbi:MAG: 7-cyano-7-deazaguanine synthase QueC [Candidatus Omnitrophota bacterium]|nr:7-cyano-7-deazaguanine synthase QueC [Candidatus Omnitrophota bacterium]